MLWAWAVAFAALPLPDYGDELARARWYQLDRLLEQGCRYDPNALAMACDDGVTDQVREGARAFEEHVAPDAGLAYLVGLSYKYEGNDDDAVAAYQRATRLDPAYDAAWYDLGETWLIAGELDRAAEAFEKVAELRTEGEAAWLGPWRRAEVAAHQHQAEVFETWMRKALERGFSFRQIAGLPNWKAFYADPALRDSVEKLITVYGTPEVLDSLRTP
jgi:tetratricopeptide (TPR) repeat protein